MRTFHLLLHGLLVVAVQAILQLDDAAIEDMLTSGGQILANLYAPVWHFQIVGDNHCCYPTWAFGGQPNAHAGDIYQADHQSPGGEECLYPNVGCECRSPGVTSGRGPEFPVYYTYNRCSENEIRVSYNLFYEKDGFYWFAIHTGHPYDWENVVISITRDSNTGLWQPTSILLGGHGRWQIHQWTDMYTVDGAAISSGQLDMAKRNAEHPFIYPGWAKHANFPDPDSVLARPLHELWFYQSTCRALRGSSVWGFPDLVNFIRADRSAIAGQKIDEVDWKGATGTPTWVHYTKGLCEIVGKTRCEWGFKDEF